MESLCDSSSLRGRHLLGTLQLAFNLVFLLDLAVQLPPRFRFLYRILKCVELKVDPHGDTHLGDGVLALTRGP